MSSLKSWILFFVILAMSTSVVKTEPITTAGTMAVGGWLLNFFSAQPQRWQTSTGTFEVRIEVPPAYRDQLSGVRYLYPLNHENPLIGQGQVLRLIAGWPTQVSAFFPTGEKRVRKSYWRVDNGAVEGEFKEPPYRFDLPFLNDTANSHFVEIGVGTGRNSGGSVSAMYRCNTLEGYYAEMLADRQFAVLTQNEFLKKAQPAATVPAPVAKPAPPPPPPASVVEYGTVNVQLLGPDERPEGGRVIIRVQSPSGKTYNLTGESRSGEMIVVSSVRVGSTVQVQPIGSSFWSSPYGVGATITLKRRAN